MSLKQDLRIRCRSLLLEFEDLFEDQKLLRAIFEMEDALKPFADELPEGSNKSARVDLIIPFMVKRRTDQHEMVLLIFLRVLLKEKCQSGDERKQKLAELIAEVELADVTSTSEQGQRSAEAKDFQQVVLSYDHGQTTDSGKRAEGFLSAEEWFDKAGENLDEWAFRIALAVFNGTSYDVIDWARRILFELLDPPKLPAKPDDPPLPPPPQIPLRKGKRLQSAGATETMELPTKPKVVKLDNPNMASEALRFIWQEFSSWHPQLIDWLTYFAAGCPVELRTRAAVAAGVLAKDDYVVVRDRLLLRWVHAELNQNEYRAAVGKALGYLILDGQYRDEVQTLLKEWASSSEPERRWAAARAYIYVGVHCPVKEVITQWRKIAQTEESTIDVAPAGNMFLRFALHMSLADAMVNFFLNASHVSDEISNEQRRAVFEEALEGLEEWVKADEMANNLPGFGLVMFLTLTKVLIAGDSPEETWPFILLHLVDPDKPQAPYCQRLARLFHKALNQSAIIQQALDSIQSWLEWIDLESQVEAPKYEARMQTLLQSVIDCDPRIRVRMRDRLRFYLRSWANHPRTSIRSAQHVLQGLREN